MHGDAPNCPRSRVVCNQMSEPTASSYTADAERFFLRVRELLPSFEEIDEEGRDNWEDPDGPLGYIRVAALARHLTDLAGRGEWEEVKVVLDEAEATIESGDAYTGELMVVPDKSGLPADSRQEVTRSDARVCGG